MGFKEDADFSRFVSMGAAGTAKVGRVLRDKYGHRPVELERYAMANKVWQTKVKRLRLPDLVCLRCGCRVESRAKSKLGIIMSHSDKTERAWNDGGMRGSDLYAFVRVDLSNGTPKVGEPIFFSSESMNSAADLARRSTPKAASEGSEVTMTWPTWVPNRSGVVQEIDIKGRIVCRWDDGSTLRYWQWRNWGGDRRCLYVKPGSRITAEESMVAGVVPLPESLACAGDIWDLPKALRAKEKTEQYAAIKATGILHRDELGESLVRIEAEEEDWRIRLEAIAALARLKPEVWTHRISTLADVANSRDEVRMEAVFTLSEISTDEASQALVAIAKNTENPVELRASAAWGLGRGVYPRPDLLLPLTLSKEPLMSLHAIVALKSIPDQSIPDLVAALGSDDDRIAASAARVMLRHECVDALLDAVRKGGRPRLWALGALGDLAPDLVRSVARATLDDETKQALEPMWLAQHDWLRRDVGRDGLEALDVQTVRFDPVTLTLDE